MNSIVVKAQEAAREAQGKVALPLNGDWYDFHRQHGKEATQHALKVAARDPAPVQKPVREQPSQKPAQQLAQPVAATRANAISAPSQPSPTPQSSHWDRCSSYDYGRTEATFDWNSTRSISHSMN